MKKLRRNLAHVVIGGSLMFLPSCGNTEQHTEMVASLEKEKARLESKIKDLESSHQQTISVKDSEIARLTELNRSLEAQVNDLKAQATERAPNSQGGEEYLGHWRCRYGEAWVTKDGDLLFNYLSPPWGRVQVYGQV